MRKNNLKYFYIISSLIWMGAIFWGSAIADYSVVPGVGEDHNDFLSGTVHILSYAILCFLFIKSFIASDLVKNKAIIYGFILASLYGATDEWHQFFVPGREAHLSDWLLDVVGAFLVFSFYKYATIINVGRKH